MNRRVLTILLLAFAIAGVCAFVVYHLVVNRMTATKSVATTRVVAAATDIKLGAVLNSADLTTVEIAGVLPKGAILESGRIEPERGQEARPGQQDERGKSQQRVSDGPAHREEQRGERHQRSERDLRYDHRARHLCGVTKEDCDGGEVAHQLDRGRDEEQ